MNFKLPRMLSGNTLKIIAAISMFIDHFGFMFFPKIQFFRILGRLAFPIFAFMIAEGAKFTKNKVKYFLTVFIVGIVCFAGNVIFNGKSTFTILTTFSFSLIMIFALDDYKTVAFSPDAKSKDRVIKLCSFVLSVIVSYIFCEIFYVDYGFIGCATPLAASLTCSLPENAPKSLKKADTLWVRLALMAIPLLILAVDLRHSQPFALISLPILLLYSEKRGKLRLKYFFYIFYPTHLVLLEGIRTLVKILK